MAASTISLEQIGEGSVRLDGTLDFDTVMQAYALLEPHLATERQVALSVSLAGVERANSAALAMMLEAQAQARRRRQDIHWADIPEELMQLARVCQVEALLANRSV